VPLTPYSFYGNRGFAELSMEEKGQIIDDTESKNTKSTTTVVTVFREYLN